MFQKQAAAGALLAVCLLLLATPGQASMSRAELRECLDLREYLREKTDDLQRRSRDLDNEDRRLDDEYDRLSGLSLMNVELAQNNYRQCRQWRSAAECYPMETRARELEQRHNERVRRLDRDNARYEREAAEWERDRARYHTRLERHEDTCVGRNAAREVMEDVCRGRYAATDFCRNVVR